MPFVNSDKRREYYRIRAAQIRDEWFAVHNKCAWCGSTYDLKLDHIDPKEKVSHRIWGWGKEAREKELAKCQALCVFCHKIKSSSEVHWRRNEGLPPRI